MKTELELRFSSGIGFIGFLTGVGGVGFCFPSRSRPEGAVTGAYMLIPEKVDTVGPDLERNMREQQRLFMLIGKAGRREISSVFCFCLKNCSSKAQTESYLSICSLIK